MKLTIEINRGELIVRVKKHLAILAKRARNREGQSIFSDITTSTTEDCIYEDMVTSGTTDLVARLKDMCSAYVRDGEVISFDMYSDRWRIDKTLIEIEDGDQKPTMDLTNALRDAIDNYLYNYVIARYLNSVSPAIGKFSDPYMESCETILKSLVELAFERRGIRVPEYPYTKSIRTEGDTIELSVGEVTTVTYTIDYGKKDDVEVKLSNRNVRLLRHTPDGVEIEAIRSGECCMVLFSRHDSDVFRHLELIIE